MIAAVRDRVERAPSAALLLILGTSILLMSPTILIAPPAWQDDSQITDHGRVLLTADASFGMSLAESGRAVVTPFWFGPATSELLFRLGGHAAIRLGSIVLAALAAFLLFRIGGGATGPSRMLPLLVALAYFFSYSAAQNYRSGRFDVLAFVLLLSSVLVLDRDGTGASPPSLRRFAASSLLVALCITAWPTAILFLPVWAWILVGILRRDRPEAHPTTSAVAILLPVAAVGLLTVSAISSHPGTPAGPLAILDALRASSSGSFRAGLHAADLVSIARSVLTDAPLFIIPPALLFARTARPRAARGLLILLVIASVVVVTNPYIHRYIYLAMSAAVLSVLLSGDLTARMRTSLTGALLLIVPVLAALQLVARPLLAIRELDERSPSAAVDAISGIDCSEAQSIYLDPFRLYYVLREAGCRPSRLFDADRESVTDHVLAAGSRYAYVILAGGREDWGDLVGYLEAQGWMVEQRGGGSHYRSRTVVLVGPVPAG